MKRIENIWTQSARYLAGEMIEEQEIRFFRWIDSDLSRKKEFEMMKKIWNNNEPYPNMNSFNSEKAWESLRSRLVQDGLVTDPQQSRYRIPKYTLLVAASILLLLCIGIPTLYLVSNGKKQSVDLIQYVAKEGSSIFNLPDKSRVFLNENSKITYAEDFVANRRVTLSGEAYFEVVPDSVSPFIVIIKNSIVTVLGTSFNVKENVGENKVEVLVESGKVKLQINAQQKSITLIPGQFGKCNGKITEFSSQKDLNYLSWKTKEFKFDNVGLDEVIRTLESAYHVQIKSDIDDLSNRRLTSTYNQQTLDVILETICTALNMKYSKTGKEYRIFNN